LFTHVVHEILHFMAGVIGDGVSNDGSNIFSGIILGSFVINGARNIMNWIRITIVIYCFIYFYVFLFIFHLIGMTTEINYASLLTVLNQNFTLEQAFKVSHEMLLDNELAFMRNKITKYNLELMQMYIKS